MFERQGLFDTRGLLDGADLFDDLLAGGVAAALFDRQVADLARERDRLIRDLLGRWVSELEPALVLDHDGRVLGLTAADHVVGWGHAVAIYVRASRPF